MSAVFDLFGGKKKRSKRIQVMGEWLEEEYMELYEGHMFAYDNSEDWVMPIATNYALVYVGVVNELLKILAEAKDYSEVVQYAARALEIEPGNKITALYCRLSQEDLQAGESESIQNQKIILQRYADDNHLLNTRFFVDAPVIIGLKPNPTKTGAALVLFSLFTGIFETFR